MGKAVLDPITECLSHNLHFNKIPGKLKAPISDFCVLQGVHHAALRQGLQEPTLGPAWWDLVSYQILSNPTSQMSQLAPSPFLFPSWLRSLPAHCSSPENGLPAICLIPPTFSNSAPGPGCLR